MHVHSCASQTLSINMKALNLKETLLVAFLVCSHAAQAATSLGSLTDSAGQPLVQTSSCSSTPCLQGVAYAAGYLSGCQVNLWRRRDPLQTMYACVMQFHSSSQRVSAPTFSLPRCNVRACFPSVQMSMSSFCLITFDFSVYQAVSACALSSAHTASRRLKEFVLCQRMKYSLFA